MKQHRGMPTGAAPGTCGTCCAACALGYFALQRLLQLGGRALAQAWRTGAGAGAPTADYEALAWVLTLAAGICAMLLPALAAARCGIPAGRGLRKPVRRGGMALAVLFVAGSALLNLVAALAGQASGSMQSMELPDGAAAQLLAFLAVCAVPALLEELLFRGALLECLRPCGAWFAVAGQAVLFALLHGRVSAIVFALPAGLFFGYLAVSAGSLWPGVGLHFLNNSIAFGMLLLEKNGMSAAAALMHRWAILLAVPAVCGALAWLLRRRYFRALPHGLPVWQLLMSPAWDCTVLFLLAAALLGL